MSTSSLQSSADLILRLYEIRREPEMRLARQWFAREFRPRSAQEIVSLFLSGERASAAYRMVTSYWEMAAALVHRGAVDADLFREANTEHMGFFSLIDPYLDELRSLTGEANYLVHWERLVRETPGAELCLRARRQLFSAWTRQAPV
jgi:hypothetical protein